MKLNRETMASAFPQDSMLFDEAVDRTLKQIHNQAVREPYAAPRPRMRRVLGWSLACVLTLLAMFGVAEGVRRGVFDFLWQRSDALPQATELVQTVPAEMTVGHTTLRINDAVYDGAAVRFVMSVSNDTVDRPLTDGEPYGDGEFGKAIAKDGVTAPYGFDWFTLDGTEYSMTGGSGGENAAGESNGEALIYFELVLTESEGEQIAAPTRDFVLGVPVKAGKNHEEKQMLIPVKYVAANLLEDITPDEPVTCHTENGAYTITVTSAKLSPIRNRVTLRVDVSDAMSEEAAWEVISPWYDIALVDEHGEEIGTPELESYGLPMNETDDARHFCISITVAPRETYPDNLFVAPVGFYGAEGAWCADMTLAIALNK